MSFINRLTGENLYSVNSGARVPRRSILGTGEHKRVAVTGIELQLPSSVGTSDALHEIHKLELGCFLFFGAARTEVSLGYPRLQD